MVAAGPVSSPQGSKQQNKEEFFCRKLKGGAQKNCMDKKGSHQNDKEVIGRYESNQMR